MERKKSVRTMTGVKSVGRAAEHGGSGDGTGHTQIQDHIGRQLRAIYDDVLNQPVPDRLLDLLEKLSKQEDNR
jgi:hypothetical protein